MMSAAEDAALRCDAVVWPASHRAWMTTTSWTSSQSRPCRPRPQA